MSSAPLRHASKVSLPAGDALRRFLRLGDVLDQVMTIDLAQRGSVRTLYGAARALVDAPLSATAALRLASALQPGDRVVLATGFPVRPWIAPAIGETDGPPGVAALAWGISRGLACTPVVLTPPGMRSQITGALAATGIMVLGPEEARAAATGPRPTVAAIVEDFTTDSALAPEAAAAVLTRHDPKALIAVEHPGPNLAGVYHSSVGVDISPGTAKTEALFRSARDQGRLTMSFTDMPNEIGSGAIREHAFSISPYAERCQCPCGAGMASVSLVDVLVVSTVANWGAYAAMAALSLLVNDRSVRFSQEQDARAIGGTVAGGAVEGLSGTCDPDAGVDGISTATSGQIVNLLAQVAEPGYGLGERRHF